MSAAIKVSVFFFFLSCTQIEARPTSLHYVPSQEDRFWSACFSGRIEDVRQFLYDASDVQKKIILNYHSHLSFTTPLMAAIGQGHTEIALLLIAHGADIHQVAEGDRTALHFAVLHNNVVVANKLLALGALLTCDKGIAKPIVYFACEQQNIAMVRLLLRYKAHVKTLSQNGFSAIHIAAQKGNRDIVQVLLQAGASVYQRTPDGKSAIHVASVSGHRAVVQYLLQYGVSSNSLDLKNRAPLHHAVLHEKKDVAEMLLKTGAFVDQRDEKGYTPLYHAVMSGNQELTALLLRYNSNKNQIFLCGKNILHLAIERKQHQYVAWFVNTYASKQLLMMQDDYGHTPLCYAIFGSHPLLIALLLGRQTEYRFFDQKAHELALELQDSDLVVLFEACKKELGM